MSETTTPCHRRSASGVSPVQLSDEEDELWDANVPELQGTLSKWTNYIHGWQDRYFALKEGTLMYYKSANETDFGCRGAVSIQKASIKPHEFDDLRFDVSVSDCCWYLRAQSVEDKQKWVDALEAYKHQMEEHNLRRHDSALSLTSNTFSTHSTNSKGPSLKGRGLSEKLAEMETFRDILCRQIETLQSYFEACSDVAQLHDAKAEVNGAADIEMHPSINKGLLLQHGLHAVDFKGEAITFKATTAGILATLSHCIELMSQREDQWRKRFEREQAIRKRIEDKYRSACHLVQSSLKFLVDDAEQAIVEKQAKVVVVGGPDYEEGPHSQIAEEEFYDAVENTLDRLQEQQEYRDKLKQISQHQMELVDMGVKSHQLWSTIDKVTNEQFHYARLLPGETTAGDPSSAWELFAEDGEMKMYKREEEIDGMVVDPLKAIHQVRGVTARELCHYFFGPEYRMEWETTVEQATVLEKISDDTMIFLQLHKRVWPAAQRDSLFWSHIRRCKESPATDTWIVCNQSTKHPDAPENQGQCLRVDLTVCFVCDTVLDPGVEKDRARREDITCKITYCSVVNPGGWAPASVLRAVYKREYPRFLKRFTHYVIEKSKNKPIMW